MISLIVSIKHYLSRIKAGSNNLCIISHNMAELISHVWDIYVNAKQFKLPKSILSFSKYLCPYGLGLYV